MRVLILFLLGLLLSGFELGNRHFNRLNKLYQKDMDKCLERCLAIRKWDKKSASTYYFSSVIYAQQFNQLSGSRKRYNCLNKSLSDSKKMESLKSDLAERTEWKQHLIQLDSLSIVLLDELKREGKTDLASTIDRKRAKLGFEAQIVKKEEPSKIKSTEEVEIIPERFAKLEGEYYGMPSGKERVAIFNKKGEQEVFELINAERIKLGMKPLIWEENLAFAARYHSYDMATQNYFNHSSYDRINGKLYKIGKTFDRIRTFYNSTFVNSENIAAGSEEAEDTYQQWYTSKGHYDNMFNPSSVRCGIGVWYDSKSTFKYYWTFCTAL